MKERFEENNCKLEEDIKNKKIMLNKITKDLDHKQSILNTL